MEKIKSKIEKLQNDSKKHDYDIKKNPNCGLENIELRQYQKEGIKWLIDLFERHQSASEETGCILSDEMGLGKTCQTIALITHIVAQKASSKVLVLSPLSVMDNWSQELVKFSPHVSTLAYTGDKDSRSELFHSFKKSPTSVLITTYEYLMRDAEMLQKVHWRLLVVDEAHRLKNAESQLYQTLTDFQIDHKVLLTGTPIQNNLRELYSLLHFIQPSIFREKHTEEFLERFSDTSSPKSVEELTELMQPFVLRRTKLQVNINLPPRAEFIIHHGLTKLQKDLYKSVLQRDANAFKNSRKVSLINILMTLRQCCAHPYIIPDVEPEPFELGEHLVEASGKFMVLDALLKHLYDNHHKVLLFSQFTTVLDIVQDYMTLREWSYERLDGSVRGEERHAAVKRFNASAGSKEEDTFAFLLSTRAGGVGLNLTSADTCIFLDGDFNPQNDVQAAARCHRIGQNRPVVVIRLIAKSTVEEVILKRAAHKLKLSTDIMESGKLAHEASASAVDVKEMIKYGLADLFSEEGEDAFDVGKFDFEKLIAKTKNKKWVIDENVGKESAEESNGNGTSIYEFEGVDYSKEKHESDTQKLNALLDMGEEEAMEETVGAKRKIKEVQRLEIQEVAKRPKKEPESAEARQKRLEEAKKRKEEKLKQKWAENGYKSAKIVFSADEDEMEEEEVEGDADEHQVRYLHYVKGDVTRPLGDDKAIVVHCVDDSGKWGKGGVFDALNRRWKAPEEQYELAAKMSDLSVGDVHLIAVDESTWVALLVAHQRDKKGRLSPIDIEAVKEGFEALRQHAKKLKAAIHMPRIGYNTPKFNWYAIERLVKKCFSNRDVSTYIYYFVRGARPMKGTEDEKMEIGDDGEKVKSSEESSEDEEPRSDKGGKGRESVNDGFSDRLESINEVLPNLFSDMSFYFYENKTENGLIDFEKLKRYIIAYDGTFEEDLPEDEDITGDFFVIVGDKKALEANGDLLKRVKTNKRIKVVKRTWIEKCVLKLRNIDCKDYIII